VRLDEGEEDESEVTQEALQGWEEGMNRKRCEDRRLMKARENGCENRFLSRVRSAAIRECEP